MFSYQFFKISKLALLFCLLISTISFLPGSAKKTEISPVNLYYADALSYFKEKKFEEAEVYLNNALKLNSSHVPSLIKLGEVNIPVS